MAPAPSPPAAPEPPPVPALDVLTEVVYVLFKNYDDERNFMCTGTLIAKDRVVTAGHCLNENHFYGWTIVAPLLPDAPRVTASTVHVRSYDFTNPSEPDIGLLILDEPIEAPVYAELTDVSRRIENGEKLEAVTIVRSAKEPEAPLKEVAKLMLEAANEYGYDHGYTAPMFSDGGDSGAGIFLVENGRPTHKLIGVIREPEPERGVDHFTRVDSDFLDWFGQHEGE